MSETENETTPSTPSKPGHKTSEFWIVAIVVICATALTIAGKTTDLNTWGAFVAGIVVPYTLGRSYVKAKEAA